MASYAETDRFVGALLGAALGDVLGWPHEGRANRVGGKSRDAQLGVADWVKRSGGRFQPYEELIEAGAYSDDTQLLIAVARSRLAGGEWWTRLAASEFPFWTVYQRGGGGASLRAAALLLKGCLPWHASAADRSKYFEAGGNGVAMRIAPHVLLHAGDEEFSGLAADILADGVLTHGHPRALVGALAYGFALWIALRREGTLGFGEIVERVHEGVSKWAEPPSIDIYWPTWLPAAKEARNFHSSWNVAVSEVMHGLDLIRESLGTGALAVDEETLVALGCFNRETSGAGTVAALAAVFLASKHAASPFEGVARAALARGADTDTIASMTGALAGAIAGSDWIGPLGAKVQDHRFIVELAQSLAGRRELALPRPGPTKQAHLTRLLAAVSQGEPRVELPIGGSARVTPHDGIRSKADRLEARAWRLESDTGQSFILKSFARLPKPTLPFKTGPSKVASAPKIASSSAPEPTPRQQHERPSSPLPNTGSSAAAHSAFAGLALRVHDLALSKEFYAVLLGLEITRETQDRVQFGSLVLQRSDGEASASRAATIFISVPDIHHSRAQISDRLGVAVSAVTDKSGRMAFMCRDPDGHLLEIYQP